MARTIPQILARAQTLGQLGTALQNLNFLGLQAQSTLAILAPLVTQINAGVASGAFDQADADDANNYQSALSEYATGVNAFLAAFNPRPGSVPQLSPPWMNGFPMMMGPRPQSASAAP